MSTTTNRKPPVRQVLINTPFQEVFSYSLKNLTFIVNNIHKEKIQ